MSFRTLIIVCFLSICAGAAWADTILLKNGDRITGAVGTVNAGAVTVTTEYAGELTIKQDAIEKIETENPLLVEREDGTTVEGVLQTRGGEQGVVVEEEWKALPVASIIRLAGNKKALKKLRPKKWSGSIDAGAAWRTGNTETFDARLSTEFKRTAKWNTLSLKLLAAYGETEGVLNTQHYAAETMWQLYPMDKLYLYGLLGAEKDDGRKLDFRARVAAGVGYDILKKEKTKLAADAGVEYAWELWAPFTPAEKEEVRKQRREAAIGALEDVGMGILSGGTVLDIAGLQSAVDWAQQLNDPLAGEDKTTENRVDLRLSARFEQVLFKRSVLSDELVLLPSVYDLGAFRMTNEIGFTTALSEHLRLRISLLTEYDSVAEEKGVEPWDNYLLTSLRFEF